MIINKHVKKLSKKLNYLSIRKCYVVYQQYTKTEMCRPQNYPTFNNLT